MKTAFDYVPEMQKSEMYLTFDARIGKKRAKNVAANEANAVGNYRLQTEMVKQGYKTKEWRSKEDSHVRPTHADVDRKRIDIFEPFEVGNSLMMFPKDHSLGAQVKEIAGCRCSLKYYK